MTTCGIYPGPKGLWAVVADDAGRASEAIPIALDDESRWELLVRVEGTLGLDYELVVPEHLRRDALVRFALTRGLGVWLAPHPLTEAIRMAAGLTTGPPRRSALLLARMPLLPPLRKHMRRVGQIPLF